MADKIKLLPEVVANQIAAGEVVQKPASVVKEMMENALDAGATIVKVNYRDGGKELIQIVDDGCGMSPVDARMAFDRHATSKIASADDLYALRTFGFRGEALASIAAVAQVELRTRRAEDEIGIQTEINGGEFVRQLPVMCPVGSQFFVRNLFYNVPARRRFLEKGSTSASQIRAEFQRIALCNPQVAFELYANDAPVYRLGPSSLAGRIVDVVGNKTIKQNLLEVSADTSIARVEGFVGRPAAAKKAGAEQFLFVNGRFFLSAYLRKAILKAYEKLIPENCQPAYFLYITVDPDRIDVNVHPQKTEVKFADTEAVWQIINAAVRETLAKTGAVSMMDFDNENPVEIPALNNTVRYDEPKAMSIEDYNPFRESYIDPDAPDPGEAFTGFDIPYDGSMEGARTGRAGFGRTTGLRSAGNPMQPAGSEFDIEIESAVFAGDGEAEAFDFIPSGGDAEAQQGFIPGTEEQFGGFTAAMPAAGGYAVALAGRRLVAVDLRRARERIRYENYLAMFRNGSAVCQQLLFPERLTLSAEEYRILDENLVDVAALGFDIALGDDCTVEVKGTPADTEAERADQLLYELLRTFGEPFTAEELRRERIAAAMARSGSGIPARGMSAEEVTALLDQLAACENRNFTPGGKAILAEITPDELRAKLN